jgi:hypothetical protein
MPLAIFRKMQMTFRAVRVISPSCSIWRGLLRALDRRSSRLLSCGVWCGNGHKTASDRLYVGADNGLDFIRSEPQLLSGQQNGHPGLETFGPFDRVSADQKRVQIVVTDSASRAPGRELAAWDDLVDASIDRRITVSAFG